LKTFLVTSLVTLGAVTDYSQTSYQHKTLNTFSTSASLMQYAAQARRSLSNAQAHALHVMALGVAPDVRAARAQNAEGKGKSELVLALWLFSVPAPAAEVPVD
jgi:hypothetical protein